MPETIEDQRVPPPQLRQRIIHTARSEKAQPVLQTPEESTSWWRRVVDRVPWQRPSFAMSAALASIMVLLFAGVVAFRMQNRLSATESELANSYEALRIVAAADEKWVVQGSTQSPQAAGVLAYSAQKNMSSMVLWGLPADETHSYVAWTQKSGAKARVGVM